MKESTENHLTPSRQEMHRKAAKRVTEISKEFKEAFELLENYPQSVTFFGANQFNQDNRYYKDAQILAARLAKELDYTIVSGGGPGIMEAANRGANEVGGKSLGLLIELPAGQVTNGYISEKFSFHYFFVRKVCLALSAEAFIFYPGGFGTLDEFFEILTLVQTRKIVGTPIICVGSEYWNKLKEFMVDEMIGRGTISANELDLFNIIDDHDTIIDMIKKLPAPDEVSYESKPETL